MSTNGWPETLTLSDGTRQDRHERVWLLLQDRQLVGLTVEAGPAVYLSTPKNQHALMKGKPDGDVPTRQAVARRVRDGSARKARGRR
ncbi:MAG: hypothetical protein QM749_16365 [Aquabacterium sp.]